MTGFVPIDVLGIGKRAGLTYARYTDAGGPGLRTLQSFANDPAFRSDQEAKLHSSAAVLLAKHLPWTVQWSSKLADLRRTAKGAAGAVALEAAYGPLVESLDRSLTLAAEQPAHKDALFKTQAEHLGALWFVHLYWVFLSSWAHKDALSTNAAMAARRARATARMMITALEGTPGDAATLLRVKATDNILVAEWNRIKPEARRGSTRLRALVEELDFFANTLAQAQIVPKNPLPLVNALGVASAFHARTHYADLEARIEAADPDRIEVILTAPQADPQVRDHYNMDYDDYRDWVAEGRPAVAAPRAPSH